LGRANDKAATAMTALSDGIGRDGIALLILASTCANPGKWYPAIQSNLAAGACLLP
jgi:hypothetical protein